MFTRRKILGSLIKKYGKLLPAPQFKDVISRPRDLDDISPKRITKTKQIIVNALRNGIPSLLASDVKINKYTPFSDAVATQLIGVLDTRLNVVAKIGDKSLKHQVDFIEKQKKEYRNLYPDIFGKTKTEGAYIYIMQLLNDYISLHDMVFCSIQSRKEINKAIDDVFIILGKMYKNEINKYNTPNLKTLYLKERILKRVQEAKKRFKSNSRFFKQFKNIFPDGFNSILNSPFETNSKRLKSFNDCILTIEENINNITPKFSTIIHGDAHPGNIMLKKINNNYAIKLLDPNPYIGFSDYIYDMGKMIHWLETIGLVILERKIQKQLIKIDVKKRNSIINVKILFLNNEIKINEEKIYMRKIISQKDYSNKCALDNIRKLAQKMRDYRWKERLTLSVASAYIGGLTRFEDPSHIMLTFVEGLKKLNAISDSATD